MANLAIDYTTGLTSATSNVLTFLPKLVVFLIILIVGYFIAKAISKILTKVLQKVGFDSLVERGGVKKALINPSTTRRASSRRSCTTRSCCSC